MQDEVKTMGTSQAQTAERAGVGLNARNIIERFDKYAVGEGKL